MYDFLKEIISTILFYITGKHIINKNDAGSLEFIQYSFEDSLPDVWYFKANLIRKHIIISPLTEKSSTKKCEYRNTLLSKENSETLPFFMYPSSQNAPRFSHSRKNTDYVRKNFDKLITDGSTDESSTWLTNTSSEQYNCSGSTLDSLLPLDNLTSKIILYIASPDNITSILEGGNKLLQSNRLLIIHIQTTTLPLYEKASSVNKITTVLNKYSFILHKSLPAGGAFNSESDLIFINEKLSPAAMDIWDAVYGDSKK